MQGSLAARGFANTLLTCMLGLYADAAALLLLQCALLTPTRVLDVHGVP
jgi:hypothetical protein